MAPASNYNVTMSDRNMPSRKVRWSDLLVSVLLVSLSYYMGSLVGRQVSTKSTSSSTATTAITTVLSSSNHIGSVSTSSKSGCRPQPVLVDVVAKESVEDTVTVNSESEVEQEKGEEEEALEEKEEVLEEEEEEEDEEENEGKEKVQKVDSTESTDDMIFSKYSHIQDENILVEQMVKDRIQSVLLQGKGISKPIARFPPSVSQYAVGIAQVPMLEFLNTFDFGSPTIKKPSNEEVLIIYNKQEALPSSSLTGQITHESGQGILKMSVADATVNCETMNVVYQNSANRKRQCFAIVPNFESYHVQKWIRNTEGGRDGDLHKAGRLYGYGWANLYKVPGNNEIEAHQEALKIYLANVDDVMKKLKKIAAKLAINNTIIVMVCNLGQADILMNFVCSAKARNLDLSHILLFATDHETYDIATSLGLASFYDEKNFANQPKQEAKVYGDAVFASMMYSKILSVQYITMLGYDVLFQDVDVTWFKNPLDFFHSESNGLENFDIIFQDDGSRMSRYSPYYANSGFYYVRNNKRTVYLFLSLLYAGDGLIRNRSHQASLIVLMVEHSSYFGLRVKVMRSDEFPAGKQFNRDKVFMTELIKKEREISLFHMSWTTNKNDKLKYFKQMGWWFVRDECEGDHLKESEVRGLDCCSIDPLLTCFYSDRPSVIDCSDKGKSDNKRGKPFWPL